MNKFKRSIEKRVLLGRVLEGICALVLIFNVFFAEDYIDKINPFMIEFENGLICGIIFLLCALLFKYTKALRNEEELKKLYNKEHDERKIYIKQKSGANVIIATSSCTILAALIAGYFNIIIFYTLLASAIFQLMVSIVIKTYYLRRN